MATTQEPALTTNGSIKKSLMILKKQMGRHREWRKIAKKERRRKIRILRANKRDNMLYTESCLQEEELLYQLELEQIKMFNDEANEKWVLAEKIAAEQWQKLQVEKEKNKQRKLVLEAKLKLEWELEQTKKQIEQEKLKEIEEEHKRKQQIFVENLDKFLTGHTDEPPVELLAGRQTRPDADLCPFFSKTGCCRFGDQCSRNHRYPGISKVLLAANFYIHFGLNNANLNEYDTDIMLEYEDSETYKEFKEFFHDVLSEFEKFGQISQFKVCNNYEKHLRGNTYIEFEELRCAVAAYRTLHTRWYGGRQLSLQFCLISSWKNAICGLQLRRRCPKGRACNFLHVFRNPKNLYNGFISDSNRDTERSERTQHSSSRSWRWSESPETDVWQRKKSRDSGNSDRRRRKESKHEHDYDRRHRRRSPRKDSVRR